MRWFVLACAVAACGPSVRTRASSSMQAVIDRACDGVHPGIAVLRQRIVKESLHVPSSCTLRGAPHVGTVIRSAAPVVISVRDAEHVRIEDVVCNGDGWATSCIEIAHSKHVSISRVAAIAARTGLALLDGTEDVTVERSRFAYNGHPLPSSNGGGIGISPGSRGIRAITLRWNRVHDNNQGIAVFNSPSPAAETSDISILDSRVYGNANDGISIAGANRTGGVIRDVLIHGNDVGCNGWPANGIGFSSACTPGTLQWGPHASAAGVGIDVIGDHIENVSITDNHSHDNVFDGISTDGRTFAQVAVHGTLVTRLSGAPFSTAWPSGHRVRIGGEPRALAAVADASHLQLQEVARDVARADLWGSSAMRATIARNVVEANGVGDVGAGIWNDAADGNHYRNNFAIDNNLEGFGCSYASGVTFEGDRARGNQRSARRTGAFVAQACFEPEFRLIAVEDPAPAIGVYADRDTTRAAILAGVRALSLGAH